MATITGFTAEKMQEILDSQIQSLAIVGGHLIATLYDTTEVDLGIVEGDVGPTGPTGPMPSFAGYDEPLNDLGNVSGTTNIDFATNNIFRINPVGAVTIAFQNLPSAGQVTAGTLIVANSSFAITWPGGTKFPNGLAPVISGETIISMLARPTAVTLGVAWYGVA